MRYMYKEYETLLGIKLFIRRIWDHTTSSGLHKNKYGRMTGTEIPQGEDKK